MNDNQFDPQLFAAFFGMQPQAFVWLAPVFDASGAEIVDFRYRYSNAAGLEYLNLQQEHLGKVCITDTPSLADHMRPVILAEMKTVFHTGQTVTSQIFNPVLNRYAKVFRIRFREGILTVIQDSTEENRAIQQLSEKQQEAEKQKAFANSILDVSPNGIFVATAMRNEQEQVYDFRIQRINPAFTKLLSLAAEQVVGRSFLEVFPASPENGALAMHLRVHQSGTPGLIEVRYRHAPTDAWFHISSVKLDDGILVTFTDITAQKQAAAEIERQRNLLENILRNSSNGISVGQMIRNQEGKITDIRTLLANEAAVRFTGFTLERYLSQTASELDPGFTSSAYFQSCVQSMNTGDPFLVQYHLQQVNKWLEISVSKMDEEHQIYIFTDITSIKEAQLALERSAEKLYTAINMSQAGFFMGTPLFSGSNEIVDFSFTLVNQGIAEFAEESPEIMVGNPVSRWFPGYYQNGLFERLRQTYISGEKQQFDFHYLGVKNEVWANVMITRLEEEVLATFTDFTPVKRLQLQLERLVADLQRSNKNLEEFAYVASHDLKEPIRKLGVFTNMLTERMEQKLGTDELKLLQSIEKAARRMGLLVDDLLEYSRISRATEQLEQIDLNAKLKLVQEDLEVLLKEKAANIEVTTLPKVMGHRRQLQQLFQNLISNALKYAKPGTAPLITIGCRTIKGREAQLPKGNPDAEKRFYLIEVADNGIGFEQQYAEKIFNVFTRLHGNAEYSGTGIGLSIARKVVENHKGYIWATGEPDVGATFHVLLPILE